MQIFVGTVCQCGMCLEISRTFLTGNKNNFSPTKSILVHCLLTDSQVLNVGVCSYEWDTLWSRCWNINLCGSESLNTANLHCLWVYRYRHLIIVNFRIYLTYTIFVKNTNVISKGLFFILAIYSDAFEWIATQLWCHQEYFRTKLWRKDFSRLPLKFRFQQSMRKPVKMATEVKHSYYN